MAPVIVPVPATTSDLPANLFVGIEAVLFDLDGVLTPTAEVHMLAWGRLFTEYLSRFAVEPYATADYFAHIDGKPRYAGVADLLSSRDLSLPYGDPSDAPDAQTICGLGNRKNVVFNEVLKRDGVTPYPGSVRLVDALVASGRQVAVVSSSRNAPEVLAAAGLADRFTVVIDGEVAAVRGIPGKPRGDTYVYGATRLGVAPAAAAVIEDAPSGIAAGCDGKFRLVLGVDRGAGAQVLADEGATYVVTDLEVVVPLVDPVGEEA